MRGQKLFTRPIEQSDFDEIRLFLQAQTGAGNVPACGLLGKLVGELVALVAMSITPDAIQIDDIVVAQQLRRKRIGRIMLDEVEQIAVKIDRGRLVVSDTAGATDFFSRVGFEREGAKWIRQVRPRGAADVSR